MKKILFSLILISNLLSNPVLVPQATISELYFPDQDNWILELDIFGTIEYESGMFDSVLISSNSGMTKIKLSVFHVGQMIFLVTRDSLINDLTINPAGDFIKIISYESQYGLSEPLTDALKFGDYPGATVSAIQNGYSICRPMLFSSFLTKDKSPTIGFPNDTLGTCGTLKGFIYDIENELIPEGAFELENELFFNTNGEFYTRVFAHKSAKIFICDISEPGCRSIRIDTLKLNVEPDSTYFGNINLQIDYTTGVYKDEIYPDNDLLFFNYPNPFNSTTTFSLTLPSDLKNKTSSIFIFNIKGQLIKKINFKNSNRIFWNGKNQQGYPQSSGTYLYTLVIDNMIKKTGSVVLLK